MIKVQENRNRIKLLYALLLSGVVHCGALFGLYMAQSDDSQSQGAYAGGESGGVLIYVNVASNGQATLQNDKALTTKRQVKNKLKSGGQAQPQTQSNQGSGGEGDGLGSGEGSGIDKVGPGEAQNILALIRKKIYSKKVFPDIAKENEWEGQVEVIFNIVENGSIDFVRVAKSSGYKVLDDASIAAVKKAAPLPYYPKQIALIMEYHIAE